MAIGQLIEKCQKMSILANFAKKWVPAKMVNFEKKIEEIKKTLFSRPNKE